jgi:antitoxin MazE
MRATVKKWGNSAAVRVEDGRVVIEPVMTPEFALDALLSGVTRDNLHDEEDFGPPAGREAL